MGRPPINGTVMSATERQQRWRAKKKKERDKIDRKAAALIAANARRKLSRAARPLADGWNLRKGDCRVVLSDIASATVSLILTAPPVDQDLAWLASWSAYVLIPGGSLICVVDPSRLPATDAALGCALRYWWLLCLPQSPEVLGDRSIVTYHRFGLWYVRHKRRGRTMMPDVLHNNDIGFVIEHLTDPGELVVDPFADTREWGRIAHRIGRLWLGCDISLVSGPL
jgi:hypothetical protein